VTALTRLPDGSYGAPETISNQELLEGPPALASDAEGNLYAAADTRDYWSGQSGIFANVAPAGTFAAESQWLQTLQEEFESPPSLVAAGEGQVAAAWLAGPVGGERVEVATLASAEGTPPQDGTPPQGPSSAGSAAGAGGTAPHIGRSS
jgi:hypothetical protein